MEERYTKTVMDHFTYPRNVGNLSNANGIGTVENPLCGDMVKLSLRIDHDTVTDARVKIFGCAAAIASSSMLTELIKGQPVQTVEKITNHHVVEALGGLPEHKIQCSVLAQEAVHEAIKNYREQKQPTMIER